MIGFRILCAQSITDGRDCESSPRTPPNLSPRSLEGPNAQFSRRGGWCRGPESIKDDSVQKSGRVRAAGGGVGGGAGGCSRSATAGRADLTTPADGVTVEATGGDGRARVPPADPP